jgi:hypothetical protein
MLPHQRTEPPRPGPQPGVVNLVTDQRWRVVNNTPNLSGEAKLVWLRFWFDLRIAAKSDVITVTRSEVATFTGSNSDRTYTRMIEALHDAGFIHVDERDKRRGTARVTLIDPYDTEQGAEFRPNDPQVEFPFAGELDSPDTVAFVPQGSGPHDAHGATDDSATLNEAQGLAPHARGAESSIDPVDATRDGASSIQQHAADKAPNPPADSTANPPLRLLDLNGVGKSKSTPTPKPPEPSKGVGDSSARPDGGKNGQSAGGNAGPRPIDGLLGKLVNLPPPDPAARLAKAQAYASEIIAIVSDNLWPEVAMRVAYAVVDGAVPDAAVGQLLAVLADDKKRASVRKPRGWFVTSVKKHFHRGNVEWRDPNFKEGV